MSTFAHSSQSEIDTLRELLDHLEDVVFCHTPDGKFVYLNPATGRLVGYTGEEARQLTFQKVIAPEYLPEAFRRLELQRRHQPTVQPWELQVVSRSGERIWVQIRTRPVYDADGRLVRVYGVARDIREKKAGEEEDRRYAEELEALVEQRTRKLRESEQRFRELAQMLPETVFEMGLDERLTFVNQSALDLFGFTLEEVGRGINGLELIAPEERDRARQNMKRILGGEDLGLNEYTAITKDGDAVPVLLHSAAIIRNGAAVGLRGFLINIRERKQVEQELARLATVVDQATESILITDREGGIRYANPAYLSASGFSSEETVGRNMRTMKCDRHSDGFYRAIWDTVTAGKVWKGRIFHSVKNGTLREFESTVSPIRDRSGEIINFVAINRDVTQERALETQLRQAQKLEAVGTLAGGIAHDFNNILSAIVGYAELAKLDAVGLPAVKDKLLEVLKGTKRARDLVKQILTFSRQGQQERKPVDVGLIVKDALRLLRATLPSTIEIRQDIDTANGTVEADSTQIHQVLMNLCTNAAHAMRANGGVLEVVLRRVEIDQHESLRLRGLRSGPSLEITVNDTGCGIRPENLERIFDPYFTTKDKGEGTGLGLAMVQGIVQAHKGAITVESQPGVGTCFRVFLPVIEVEPESFREPAAAAKLRMGSERVLFVDDENDLVEIGRLMLERLGYSVATRTSSIEALELFKADPGKYDLVITDLTMPNLTGDLLAKSLLALRPDLPIILCTGYSERMTEARAREMGIKAFLMKPVTLQDLSDTTRRVLGA